MPSLTIILAFLLLATCTNAGGSVGIVGLGRVIFEPLCCYTCLSSFWGLELSCTEAQPATQDSGGSPSCHATNVPYLNSLAYCMKVKCAADNVSESQVDSCWSKVAGDGMLVSSLQDNLSPSAPTIQLPYDAVALENTSLVNDQYYKDSRKTIQNYVNQESAHALYGTINIVVVIGFCFYLGVLRLAIFYLPKLSLPHPISSFLSKHIYETALVGSIHLRKFPGNLGYIPSRGLSILIILYIGLNAALCAINYPSLEPDTWYIGSKKQQLSFVADRLGIMAFANLTLAVMFSGRNTPLLWITGRSRTDILTFHRWAARVAAVQAVAHVVIYWTNTSRFGDNMFTLSAGIRTVNFNPMYWTYGIVAIGAMGFMVFVLSILPFRVRWYEIFLFVHIILAILILVGLWYHVGLRYDKAYGYEVWLYIAFAFWGFDRLARPIRIILLNWKSWFLPIHPGAIVELLPGDEFVKVTVFPSTTWKFSAGQHCFLYFPTLGTNPFQSHPFSIASWNNGKISKSTLGRTPTPTRAVDQPLGVSYGANSGQPDHTSLRTSDVDPAIELQDIDLRHSPPSNKSPNSSRPSISFILRPERGLTRHLHHRLTKASKLTISKSITVIAEGPYGLPPTTSLQNADTILAIAGGIGITSILGYLNLYLTTLRSFVSDVENVQQSRGRGRGRATRFLLFWSVREKSLIEAINSQLEDVDVLRRKGVELTIVCTGENDHSDERLDVGGIVTGELQSEGNVGRRVCVVNCGPGGMADIVRAAVVQSIGQRGVDVRLVEEAFGW